MLGKVANGFGLLGLAGLLAEAQAREPARGASPHRQPLGRQAPAARAPGKARDLHLLERRAIAR